MGTARRLLLFIAVATPALTAFPTGHAAAQMPWPGDPPQGGAQAPWPGTASPGMMGAPPPPMGGMGGGMSGGGMMGGGGMGGGMGGGGAEPPCMAEFSKLRGEVEKRGMAAKAAGQKKVGREEMCKYITTFFEAEAKWVKYTETNVQTCGIPMQIVSQLKQMHSNTEQTKTRICTAGPAPGGGAPSLHDALDSSRTTSPDGAKAGATFETMTGPVIR
jgi:hypothetical protein